MRFGGKIDYSVKTLFFKQRQYDTAVSNITLNKAVIREFLDIQKVLEVTGVSQLVKVGDAVFRGRLSRSDGRHAIR